MRTVIVLSALSETTVPSRTFGAPAACSARRQRAARQRRRPARRRRPAPRRPLPQRPRREPPRPEPRRRPLPAQPPRPPLPARSRACPQRPRRRPEQPPRRPRSSRCSPDQPSRLSNLVGVEAALAGDRQRSREVALGGAHTGRVLELACGELEAQAEEVAARGPDLLDELVVLEVAQLLGGHHPSSRRTNFVLIGSLRPARRIASRASGSGPPARSNIPRAGLTSATQPSGEPLPEPMRVSAGFFV